MTNKQIQKIKKDIAWWLLCIIPYSLRNPQISDQEKLEMGCPITACVIRERAFSIFLWNICIKSIKE